VSARRRPASRTRSCSASCGGHFVRLFAPRKYGKTSLLKRALRDGEEQEGLIPVLVDLYRVSSITDVTVRFERAYSKHLKGALRTKIEEFLQKTGIGLSLGAYGISAKLQLDPKADPLPALHALLDLPLRLEESGGYRAFIALDEFQDVDKVPDLDGLIRSHIQYQGEVASYVFAGSEPGLMKQLFENKDRPLYGSAVPMRLQRLADEDIAAYVADRFKATNRRVGAQRGWVSPGEIPVCPGCSTAVDRFFDDSCPPGYSRVPTEVMLQLLLNVQTNEGDADAGRWLR